MLIADIAVGTNEGLELLERFKMVAKGFELCIACIIKELLMFKT